MRSLWVSSLLVVSLFVSAACSGSDGDGAEQARGQLMAAAAQKVSDDHSFRFEGTLAYPIGQGTIDMPVTGMADTGSGEAGTDADPFTVMDLDLSRSPLAGARGGLVRMIVTGQTIYVRFPEGDEPGTGTGPGGKSWGKFDLASSDQGGAGLELLVERGRSARPARWLALLTGVRDVDEEGTEEIRDVETRHFTMTADLREVAGNAPSPFALAAEDLLDTIGAVTVSVEAWLGPDDLPRRITYMLDPAVSKDLAHATVDLFDYGTPVERVLPPVSEVFDFSAVLGAEG